MKPMELTEEELELITKALWFSIDSGIAEYEGIAVQLFQALYEKIDASLCQ